MAESKTTLPIEQWAQYYGLGGLPTEWPHPRTHALSDWAANDLEQALKTLQAIDLEAVNSLQQAMRELHELSQALRETMDRGGRVFLGGCGATGRLALSLESLWREMASSNEHVHAVVAGGDVALVQALEGFEDHPEYGREALPIQKEDLFVGCTEGGETPFVIGATEKAAAICRRPPYFLYCNPRDVLKKEVERSRTVIERPDIRDISLPTGPMALAGSTRLQASTVLMLFVGVALFAGEVQDPEQVWNDYVAYLRHRDWQELAPFITKETEIYKNREHLLYVADAMASTVLTDTTERAPTFQLEPFDNATASDSKPSTAYLKIPGVYSALGAWEHLLNRQPQALNWTERDKRTTYDYLMGFDFSEAGILRRTQRLKSSPQHEFHIERSSKKVSLCFQGRTVEVPAFEGPELFDHLTLKMLLNAHSTLVMGRLGRYEGNLMTYVKPTNGKLVDRAARYIVALLEKQDHIVGYKQAVEELMRLKEIHVTEDSIVHTAVKNLAARSY